MNAVLPPTEARAPPGLKPVPLPAAGQDASRPEARTLAGRKPGCLRLKPVPLPIASRDASD